MCGQQRRDYVEGWGWAHTRLWVAARVAHSGPELRVELTRHELERIRLLHARDQVERHRRRVGEPLGARGGRGCAFSRWFDGGEMPRLRDTWTE